MSLEQDAAAIKRVTKSAKVFSAQLEKFAGAVEKNVEQVVRKVCLDLYTEIVMRTPVDTGRAKASWSIDLSNKGDVEPEGEQPNFGETKAFEKMANFRWDIKDGTVYIYNNLEYIVPLERGHSRQAPRGMVAVSLAQFNRMLLKRYKEMM